MKITCTVKIKRITFIKSNYYNLIDDLVIKEIYERETLYIGQKLDIIVLGLQMTYQGKEISLY